MFNKNIPPVSIKNKYTSTISPMPNFKFAPLPSGVNKYSSYYANAIGVKPRATSSANIKMGGVY